MSFGGDGVGRRIRSQSQQLFSQGMSLSRSSPRGHLRRRSEMWFSRKRIFSLAPIALTREESQLHLSRAAGNVRRQNAAFVLDNRCKLGLIAEGIRQKISLFDNSMHQLVRERGIKSSDIQHSIRSQSSMCCCTTDEEQGRISTFKSKSVILKLTESKHNMRHRHELPHRKQMIFLRKGEEFNGENSGRQYENPKGS